MCCAGGTTNLQEQQGSLTTAQLCGTKFSPPPTNVCVCVCVCIYLVVVYKTCATLMCSCLLIYICQVVLLFVSFVTLWTLLLVYSKSILCTKLYFYGLFKQTYFCKFFLSPQITSFSFSSQYYIFSICFLQAIYLFTYCY